MVCAIQQHVRERSLRRSQGAELRCTFLDHVTKVVWTLLGHLPPNVYLRAGDAIHLVSARAAGFSDIWSNDRHLLQAARHFKLHGRARFSGPALVSL